MNKKFKKIIKYFLISLLFLTTVFAYYSNSLIGVKEISKNYYKELKTELKNQNYKTNIIVISGKRSIWFNNFLSNFGNAFKKSRHLRGEAIDILVFDINSDDSINSEDVDIVFEILDKKIIKENGGIGTYKTKKFFLTKQMIHFDCRGYKARWHK